MEGFICFVVALGAWKIFTDISHEVKERLKREHPEGHCVHWEDQKGWVKDD